MRRFGPAVNQPVIARLNRCSVVVLRYLVRLFRVSNTKRSSPIRDVQILAL